MTAELPVNFTSTGCTWLSEFPMLAPAVMPPTASTSKALDAGATRVEAAKKDDRTTPTILSWSPPSKAEPGVPCWMEVNAPYPFSRVDLSRVNTNRQPCSTLSLLHLFRSINFVDAIKTPISTRSVLCLNVQRRLGHYSKQELCSEFRFLFLLFREGAIFCATFKFKDCGRSHQPRRPRCAPTLLKNVVSLDVPVLCNQFRG